MDPASRLAFRKAFDPPAIAAMHRLFADAARNREIHEEAAAGLARLGEAPVLAVFGAWDDYLRFGRQWRRLLPDVTSHKVPRSFHFPMNDNPQLVAEAITSWMG